MDHKLNVYKLLGTRLPPVPCTLLSIGMIAAIFLIDLHLPLGIGCGALYVVALLVSKSTGNRQIPFLLAVVCTALTTFAFFGAPGGVTLATAMTSRALAVFALWAAAVLVSQHASAADELQARNERYKLAVGAARVGIWDRNIISDELYLTEPLQEMLDSQSDLPRTWDEWTSRIHPEDRKQARESAELHVEGETEHYNVEFRMLSRGGEWRWYFSRGMVQRDETGRPVRMYGALTDTTIRRKAEDELKHYAMQLEAAKTVQEENGQRLAKLVEDLDEASCRAEAAARSKSEFLANMSHEIRTPLTAILGFTDVLVDESWGRHNTLKYLNIIKRNGENLLEIINDILDISKIEAGRVQVERIPTSPAAIVADVQSLMGLRAQEKSLELAAETDGLIPETIQSDPTRLRQILINLVGNAIKFTEKGSVRIICKFLESANSDSGEPHLEISVVDTGCGIPLDRLESLFDPFVQADASTTRKSGGTGLGLTICRRLAVLLGGKINVSSEPGAGSTFRLTVPVGSLEGVKMVELSSALETRPKPEQASHGESLSCNVLLAEDGLDNQRLISFVLGKAGATVTIAENGRIAVEKATAAAESGRPYDVILMDMNMPELDGYGATRELRERGHTTPIIALTAFAMKGDREKCLAAGCTDYSAKPVDRKRLIAAIARYTDPEACTEAPESLVTV